MRLVSDDQFILLMLTLIGFGTWAYVRGRETIFYLLALLMVGFAFMGVAIGTGDEPEKGEAR